MPELRGLVPAYGDPVYNDGMSLTIGTTLIEETYAEAFGMRFTRLLITADDEYWLDAAVQEFTGFASSVIGCDLEAGRERSLDAVETPDGRPGAAVLAFAFSKVDLGTAVANRVGQCVMTCPTTAVYNGLESEARVALGRHLRYFGDGFQKSKLLGERRYWRIPVMDGEFLVEDRIGVGKGIAGGNVILQGEDLTALLVAARRAVDSIRETPGVIAPFPGGVVRSGSKVGSRYRKLKASTAEMFCPTLRGRVDTRLHPSANAALEIVLDGINQSVVRQALAQVIRAACGREVVAISAGNYGGKLGPYHFHLHEILGSVSPEQPAASD